MEVLTPWNLANATNQGLPPPTQRARWNLFQHTTQILHSLLNAITCVFCLPFHPTYNFPLDVTEDITSKYSVPHSPHPSWLLSIWECKLTPPTFPPTILLSLGSHAVLNSFQNSFNSFPSSFLPLNVTISQSLNLTFFTLSSLVNSFIAWFMLLLLSADDGHIHPYFPGSLISSRLVFQQPASVCTWKAHW